jgi:hypothetical protein
MASTLTMDQDADATMDDIEALYANVSPETTTASSIAPWITPILQHHSQRIINLSKIAEMGKQSIARLQKTLEENEFPSVILLSFTTI